MKLEKREITLNEKDTLFDMLFFERNLAREYRRAMETQTRKEARALLQTNADELRRPVKKLEEFLEKPPKM